MGVRRYLLVLEMDLLAVDEQCDLGPIGIVGDHVIPQGF